MMVAAELAPLIVRLSLISRSPVALLSSLAPAIVSVKVPAGSLIVLFLPLASAAMIADRSEMCPVESWPVLKFVATESTVVLTINVAGARRVSRASSRGRDRVRFCRCTTSSDRFREENPNMKVSLSESKGESLKSGQVGHSAIGRTIRPEHLEHRGDSCASLNRVFSPRRVGPHQRLAAPTSSVAGSRPRTEKSTYWVSGKALSGRFTDWQVCKRFVRGDLQTWPALIAP